VLGLLLVVVTPHGSDFGSRSLCHQLVPLGALVHGVGGRAEDQDEAAANGGQEKTADQLMTLPALPWPP
jgi:hypothetical protein